MILMIVHSLTSRSKSRWSKVVLKQKFWRGYLRHSCGLFAASLKYVLENNSNSDSSQAVNGLLVFY